MPDGTPEVDHIANFRPVAWCWGGEIHFFKGESVKVHIEVTLDSGGTVTVTGEDLSVEDVNEVFTLLSRYPVTTPEATCPTE